VLLKTSNRKTSNYKSKRLLLHKLAPRNNTKRSIQETSFLMRIVMNWLSIAVRIAEVYPADYNIGVSNDLAICWKFCVWRLAKVLSSHPAPLLMTLASHLMPLIHGLYKNMSLHNTCSFCVWTTQADFVRLFQHIRTPYIWGTWIIITE
jgi:hypothetical protein